MNITLVKHGTNGAPEGSENWDTFEAKPLSRIEFRANGTGRTSSFWTARSVFNLLPAAAVAAGKDDLLISLGTGTEVIARATKGGINVKTQSSTPADNDNAMLIPVASSSMFAPLAAATRPRFACRVNLTALATMVFGAGFDENITSPVSNATAGDGAGFYFDPAAEVATGTAAANWALSQKVAGADTWIDSGIPVLAGRDYELVVEYGEDLKPVYFIDGVNVGTGVAGTSAALLGVVVGIQVNGSPAGQIDFDCRYVAVERLIG